jgi:hypothetical protein
MVCGVALAILSRSRGGSHTAGPFTAQQLQKDFLQLRRAMESLHPRLYQFTPKAQFDRFLDEQYDTIYRDMSLEEFYAIVKPAVAMVGCSHARVQTPEGYWENCPGRMFPLELVFLEEGAYALRSYADSTAVTPGSEIVAINGVPMAEILDVMKRNISADGHREPWKRYRLNGAFVYLYALLYGYPERFFISCRAPGESEPNETTLSPVGLDHVRRSPDPRHATGDWVDDDLGFEILDDRNVAIITIKTFAYYGETEKFHDFVDNAFAQISARGVERLIVDLRGNDGGDPFCSTHLLSYIENKPVPYFARRYGQYEEFADPIPLAENRFEGDLLVLIDGGCSSSTGHLCAVLDYHRIGRFVGGETAATYSCNDASKSITLNNTKLRINMPRRIFSAAVAGFSMSRGIQPDHPASPEIDDLIRGRDTVIEYALDLWDSSRDP